MGTSTGPCPCPAVAITVAATGPTSVEVTVVSGGPVNVTLGAQYAAGVVAEHTFTNVTAGASHLIVATNACGAHAQASVTTVAYCPSLRLDTGNCIMPCGTEVGFAYRDNALRDPAATVSFTHCNGEISYAYPSPGMYGDVRAEVPFYDGGEEVVGYLANRSDCAPDIIGVTVE